MVAEPIVGVRPPAWATAPDAGRRFAGIAAAGAIAGLLVGGLGSRVAMRIAALVAPDTAQGLITEAGATVGEITFGGTMFLVVFVGIGSAALGTAFYLAVLPWLPRHRRSRALAFAGLELAVFGTILLDPGNPDFTILGRPLLDVVVFGSLFVLHGVALVLLIEPSERAVGSLAGRGRWWARLVNTVAIVAAAVTGLAAVVLVGLAGGWNEVPMIALVASAAGLAVVDPVRSRPITRPALHAVGAVALTILGGSGLLELVDAVTTIA